MRNESEIPVPPWRRSGAQRSSKPQLSTELIVRTALELLDAEGLDAVTMRRVAHALGTGAASLYAHVSGKAELDELMLDRTLAEVELPEPDEHCWIEQTKGLLCGQLHAMMAHPGIAKVAWSTMVPVGTHALRHVEALLALLRAGGLSERHAAYGLDVLSMYTKAFAYEGSIWASGAIDAEAARRGEQVAAYLESLPSQMFAHTRTIGAYFNADTAADRFEFGLDAILHGLTAQAA